MTDGHPEQSARDKLVTKGRRIEDDRWCRIIVIQQLDGSWLIDGASSPVRLTGDDMVALARAILTRARQS